MKAVFTCSIVAFLAFSSLSPVEHEVLEIMISPFASASYSHFESPAITVVADALGADCRDLSRWHGRS